MNGDVDDLLLQRLVDGEMSHEDRCRVLRSLDRRPRLWRRLALAFVEDQVWRTELRSLDAERRTQSQRATALSPARTNPWRWALALAAAVSLFAVLGLGYQIGRQHALRHTVASSLDQSPQEESPAAGGAAEGGAPSVPAAPYRVRLRYPGDAGDQSLDLPVYDASELQRPYWQEPDRSSLEDLNRELASRGYRLDWSTEYLSSNLDSGKRLFVPLQTVAIEYHGQ